MVEIAVQDRRRRKLQRETHGLAAGTADATFVDGVNHDLSPSLFRKASVTAPGVASVAFNAIPPKSAASRAASRSIAGRRRASGSCEVAASETGVIVQPAARARMAGSARISPRSELPSKTSSARASSSGVSTASSQSPRSINSRRKMPPSRPQDRVGVTSLPPRRRKMVLRLPSVSRRAHCRIGPRPRLSLWRDGTALRQRGRARSSCGAGARPCRRRDRRHRERPARRHGAERAAAPTKAPCSSSVSRTRKGSRACTAEPDNAARALSRSNGRPLVSSRRLHARRGGSGSRRTEPVPQRSVSIRPMGLRALSK